MRQSAFEQPLRQQSVLDLGNIVKKSVEQQKMLAWQYNTIGVSDGITMGSEGELPDLAPE